MAITAKDIETLQIYADGVLNRAEHHAERVKGIALALLGGIVWRAEPGTIEIKQYQGGLANVLWMVVNGKRYALAYNHETGQIEMRDRTQSGAALHIFDDDTPVRAVEGLFRSL
jgi:hypothetical protein